MAFPTQDSNILSVLVQIGWLVFIAFSIFYGQRIQMWNMLREVGSSLADFKALRDQGRKVSISAIKEVGKPQYDPTSRIDEFLEHRLILPVDLDPAGIVWKMDHVLDVRLVQYRDEVKIMAPEADESQINNLELMLGCAGALNYIYKWVRHYYLLGKKTMNLYIVMQIQMVLPLIMREAKALASGLRAFNMGQPIGDGAGPLVAAKLMHGYETVGITKDIVMAKVPIEGRTAYVLKAEGPGANLGKPGDAIKKIIEENNGRISTVITVDAGGKLEGEKTGGVIDGVGVAIGGLGIESFKVDETTLEHKVPVNLVLIKQDPLEAIATMLKEIVDAADVAIERVKRLIVEKTKAGDSIIIAGIGNTVGIGQ